MRTKIPPEIYETLDALSAKMNITIPTVIKILTLKHGATLRFEDIDTYLPPDANGHLTHRGRYGNGRRDKPKKS